jgi:hypothetical protein
MPAQEGHAWMQRSSPARTLTSFPRMSHRLVACSQQRYRHPRLATSNCDGAAAEAGGRGAVRKTVFTCPGDDNSHHRRDGAVRKNERAHGIRNRLRGGMPLVLLGMVGGVVREASRPERAMCSLRLRLAQVRLWTRRDARIIQTWGLRQQVPDENPGVHGTPSPTRQGCRSR